MTHHIPEPLPPSEPEDLPPPENTFRRVYFGQLSEPLVPDHPEPPEAEEDELTRAALTDPDASELSRPHTEPTPWRWVVLVLLAAGSLWVLFARR